MEPVMRDTHEHELLVIVERFFSAYNEMDLDTFAEPLADDIRWGHHNRFSGTGAEQLLQSVKDIQAKLPDRRFGVAGVFAIAGAGAASRIRRIR
jgi:hypothetical protein